MGVLIEWASGLVKDWVNVLYSKLVVQRSWISEVLSYRFWMELSASDRKRGRFGSIHHLRLNTWWLNKEFLSSDEWYSNKIKRIFYEESPKNKLQIFTKRTRLLIYKQNSVPYTTSTTMLLFHVVTVKINALSISVELNNFLPWRT